ncbi:hypothetical protein VTP01DRAFT_9075 [Rhizomucor pusillus]|uniref:uncharacterized protein n=1 Tax=Rhizomucor pusillus TaxID=4840 RepID=UPI0037442715
MFVPTIKYRKANGEPIPNKSIAAPEPPSTLIPTKQQEAVSSNSESEQTISGNPRISGATVSGTADNQQQADVNGSETDSKKNEQQQEDTTKETEESRGEPKIEVDPEDDERLLITLSTGKQYTTDRYCPHAGADLSYLGEVAEDEYPPEIGPIIVCTLHYWEFALEKGGRSGGGIATLNACPVKASGEPCPMDNKDSKLAW